MPRVYPPIEGTPPDHALTPSIIETCAGFTAGVVSTFVVHPFDVIKTRLQVDQSAKIKVGGSLRIIRDIVRHEGAVLGFARGMTPNLVGNSASWALYFLWYGNIKDRLHEYRGGKNAELKAVDYLAASAAAGKSFQTGFKTWRITDSMAMAGLATAVLLNPIWVLKTRMLSTGRKAPGAYESVTHGVLSIYQKEGIRGFYRGMVPSLWGVSHGAIQFMAYEELKIWRLAVITGESRATMKSGKHNKKLELSNFDVLGLSAFSKTVAGVLTYPFQVVRARLQMYNAGSSYTSATDVVKQVAKKEGLGGFYKGLGPNLARIVPATCITFLIYENTKSYLGQLYYEPHLDELAEEEAANAASAVAPTSKTANIVNAVSTQTPDITPSIVERPGGVANSITKS